VLRASIYTVSLKMLNTGVPETIWRQCRLLP